MFQLTFPQPEMLPQIDLCRLITAVQSSVPRPLVQRLAEDIRSRMSPHPASQKTKNVPRLHGDEIPGMQHKYKETVLFFPAEVGEIIKPNSNCSRLVMPLLNPNPIGTVLPCVLYVLFSMGPIHLGRLRSDLQVE
jgi:hypothetical protein